MLKQAGVVLTSADVVLTPSQQLIKQVAEKYHLTYRDLVYTRSRDARTTCARHEAIQLLSETYPRMSKSKIGRMFGMDPSAVSYIMKKDLKVNGWAAKLPSLLSQPARKRMRLPYAGASDVTA